MPTQGKISVIVPIYKVESYLPKCLDSIVNQTYRNLEIILVDDGSPDNCGAICDEYAARDDRIIVIHKSNGGLSFARNVGLDTATGDYIGFVDSDDWIEPNMYEYLLHGIQKQGADIAVCGIFEELPDRCFCRKWDKAEVFDTEAGLEQLFLRKKYSHSVWDKLYRYSLFEGIRFPEGRNFEDIATTHRVFERAKAVQLLPEAKYHYLQRRDSIMGDGSLRNRVDSYLAAREQYLRMKDAWPQFRELLEAWCVSVAVGIWGVYLSNPRVVQGIPQYGGGDRCLCQGPSPRSYKGGGNSGTGGKYGSPLDVIHELVGLCNSRDHKLFLPA